jgi:hypothetical protein
MNYILNQDCPQFWLKKGAVAEPSISKKGYIIWINKAENEYTCLPNNLVENSKFFDKEEEKIWHKDWKSRIGDHYFYFDTFGFIEQNRFYNDYIDNNRILMGNFFKTKYEAQMWKKRLEALAIKQTGTPNYFWINTAMGQRRVSGHPELWDANPIDKKFATKQEILDYQKEYTECLEFFNK